MTTTLATTSCSYCGAINVGTRFCESCGQAHTVALPPAVVTDRGAPGPWSAIALVSLLAWGVVPSITGLINDLSNNYSAWAMLGPYWLLLAATVLSAIAAAAVAHISAGAKVGAIFLAIAFGLLSGIPVLLGGWYYGSPFFWALGCVALAALFISWALWTSLRGRAYLGLLIGSGLYAIFPFGTLLLARNMPYQVAYVLLWSMVVLASVLIARALHRSAPVRRPSANKYVVAGSASERTNTLAILSLVFGVLTTVAVPIVLGHIAKAQIRRTGEGGNGMATAGLVLGYIWAAVWLVGAIVYSIAISTALNQFSYLGY